MKEAVYYKDGVLTIIYPNYMSINRKYGELFDWLGDMDIITASELGQDYICMDCIVFLFTDNDEYELMKNGKVSIKEIGALDTILDFSNKNHRDFYNWYIQ